MRFSLDGGSLSPRRFSRDVASLSPGLLSRRRFGLDRSPLLDFERITEDLLSLSTADLSPRRFSRDVASLSPGLLSRRRFSLYGASVSMVLLSLISNAVQRICCLTDRVLLNTKVKKVCVPPPY